MLARQEEDELMQQVVKETQERIRLMEESQRRWQQDHMSPPTMAQQTVVRACTSGWVVLQFILLTHASLIIMLFFLCLQPQ